MRLIHRDGVVSADGGAAVEQAADERDRGCLAHVVCMRFEGEPHDRRLYLFHVLAEAFAHHDLKLLLLLAVHLADGGGHRHVQSLPLADIAERLDVLRKAGASVAAARVEEVFADTAVRGHSLFDGEDVGPHLVAELRDLVHEADTRREHGVRRVFSDLGGGRVHKYYLFFAYKGAVKLAHHRARFVGGGADHDAVRVQAVFDRHALFEKFGV